MSTLSGGPNIVYDGLVLYLDAANRISYPGSGTTWTDISRTQSNSTLINGPAFNADNGGNIVFDGTNDHTTITPTPSSLTGNKPFSVAGWFKASGTWTAGASWGIGGDVTNQGINSYIITGNNFISIDLWGTSTYATNQTYSTTQWKYIVWTYNGTSFTTSNIIIYVDNIAYTGASLTVGRGGSGTPSINTTGVVLGRASVGTALYYGKPIIANFSIYNKVLSATEVLQNYNATKGRFGL
jgi:hypothetical protein